jgi:hypothetical protein
MRWDDPAVARVRALIAAELRNLPDADDLGTPKEQRRSWRHGQMLRTWDRQASVACCSLRGIDARGAELPTWLPVLLIADEWLTGEASALDAREAGWSVADRSRRAQVASSLDLLHGRASLQRTPGGAIVPGPLADAIEAQGRSIEPHLPLSIERVRERIAELEREREPHERRIAEVIAAFARGTADA